jgi:hypothetical protein
MRYVERTQLLRVRLFEPPEGWETQNGSLARLTSGVPYGLSFTTVQGQRSEIGFTLDKLEGLDDRVLTGPWMDEQAMSESDFRQGRVS